MKEIMITGTGTQYDGKSVMVPDDQHCWTVIRPPKVTDWLFNDPQTEVDFERLDCTFTGVVFEKDGHRAEIWAPLHQHEEVIRQAEEASKLFSGVKPPPRSSKPKPKPDPVAVVSLESELDGDEWDLDSEDDDEPFEALFTRKQREVEDKIMERMKATLLWEGPLKPGKKTFKITDIT